jgi:hypothetical protein
LREQPKLPWALYGRSLAERSKGQTQAADADLAAATGMAPRIVQAARRYGFEGPPAKAAGG